MNVTATKFGYKIDGYPLDNAQFAALKTSGEVAFIALSAGQLWENCSCGKEPVCVNCFKCSSHCKCGASFWSITPAGMSKAMMSFGLELNVDGIKLQGTDNIDVLLTNAKTKFEQEQKENTERARVAEEKSAALEKSRKDKIAVWELGKVALKIDDSMIKYDIIESIAVGYHTTRLVRFNAPKELAGLEGVKSEYRGYDTDYSSLLAPKEVADRLNAPLLDAEWIKRRAEILGEPGISEVESALSATGHDEFKIQIRHGDSPSERDFYSDKENCLAVIKRWVEIEMEIAEKGERRTQWMSMSRVTRGPFFEKVASYIDADRKSREEIIADVIGVTAKLVATWEASKPLIEARRQEAARQQAEERKRLELKNAEELKEYRRKAEAERLAKREVIRQKVVKECEGKKKAEMLSTFAYLKQSYTKDRMIEAIIDHEMNPVPKSKKEDYNDDGDAGIDY